MSSETQEVTVTRTIFTSPARVYAAFTRAEGWCEWCCETAEIDMRIGGRLHIYTEGYNAYGEFTMLEENKAVVFTWDGDKEPPTRIHVSLDPQADHTILTFKVIGLGPEDGWASFAEFLERVWGRALDNLKDVLEKKSGT